MISPYPAQLLQFSPVERDKDKWLDILLKGFSAHEKHEILALVKRLIKNNVEVVEKGMLTGILPKKKTHSGTALKGT